MFKSSALFASLLAFCIVFPAAAQSVTSICTDTECLIITLPLPSQHDLYTSFGDALDEFAHSDFENAMCVESLESFITGYSWEDDLLYEPCEDSFDDEPPAYSLWDAVKVFNLLDPYA